MSTNKKVQYRRPEAAPPGPGAAWQAQWARVPDEWKRGAYRLDQAPFNEVFTRNTNYLRSTKEYMFAPASSALIGQEVAWWLWSMWEGGDRKVEPAMLAAWVRGIDSLCAQRSLFTGDRTEASVSDFDPDTATAEAVRLFVIKNGREPSNGNRRNIDAVSQSIHKYVTIRCTDVDWWDHDVWSLMLDQRIPRRPLEPMAHKPMNLATVEPDWLREGLRFFLSRCLINDLLVWSTACNRLSCIGTLFGEFCVEHGVTTPVLADNPAQVRLLIDQYTAWLRRSTAGTRGHGLSPSSLASARTSLSKFYEYMFACQDEAAVFTGDPRWRDLDSIHSVLFPPELRRSRKFTKVGPRHLTPHEVSALLEYLPVLGTPSDQSITVGGEPYGPPITVNGIGDPSAMRVWLLQAFTGRRQSEILMLAYNPLESLGLPDTDDADPTAFVARLRYAQTKVDGVDPTILVDSRVVRVIREQQEWVREKYPNLAEPPHLFPNPRYNHWGTRPRQAPSYNVALRRLNNVAPLRRETGEPLLFTKTHDLRHTKATDLLNAGVPINVVQRYLGHKSPEMTMRYAQTLEATAQAAFLNYRKVGRDGADLSIRPRDVLDMTTLGSRTDRILPNGYCLLPPSKTCDKGNACLPCPSFATDATHLSELRAQREGIVTLIAERSKQWLAKRGTPMPDDNVWLVGRRAELASVEAIIARLDTEPTKPVLGPGIVPITLITNRDDAATLHDQTKRRLDP